MLDLEAGCLRLGAGLASSLPSYFKQNTSFVLLFLPLGKTVIMVITLVLFDSQGYY